MPAGDGQPNAGHANDLRPLTGELDVVIAFSQHGRLPYTTYNTLVSAALAAGGMSNVSAAYTAYRDAWDALESGRGAWLDRMTTGQNSTETAALRKGEVWNLCSRGLVPAPPPP